MRSKTAKLLAQFSCPFCGKGFEQKSKLQRHIDTSHPPSAPSAADVERMLKGITFPKSKSGIISHVRKQDDPKKENIISVLRKISDKKYQNLVQLEKETGRVK